MTPQPPKPVELKPCPFCRKSEEVYVTHNSTGFDGRKLMSVGCCAVIIDYEPTCYERWNTRATPSTHVLAPREPTEKMVNAGHKQYMQDNGIYWERNVYRAMLAAIPQAEGKDDGYEYFWLIESGPTDAPDYLFHERWRWHWTKDINKAWKTHDREIATIMFIEHARKSSRVTQHGFLKKPATTERDE